MKFINDNLDIILKWLFFIFCFVFAVSNPKAQDNDFYLDNLKVGGYAFSSSKFVTLPSGNFRISFDLVPYNFQPQQKLYVSIVVCSDYDFEGGFGDTGISNINIINTNKSCKYPNSSYSKGRIKIINFNLVTNVGNEFSGGLSVYSPAQFSITLISFNLSSSNFVSINDLPTDIDLTDTNTKIDNTNNKLDNLNNNINDDNVDSSQNDITNFFNQFSSGDDKGLQDIINLPLQYVSNLSSACKPINLPLGQLGQTTLPCMSTSVYNQPKVKSIIDTISVVINGLIMYKCISSLLLFIHDLRDPDKDNLEVMDL